MAVTVGQILAALERWAPPAVAWERDTVGLLIGEPEAPVTRVLIALDATEAVLRQAVETGAELVVTHHPLLFRPLRTLSEATAGPVAGLAVRFVRENVALVAVHTNLDFITGGTSFALAELLGLTDVELLAPVPAPVGLTGGPFGNGAIGTWTATDGAPDVVLSAIRDRLGAAGLRVSGEAPTGTVRRVAVCGGSGSDLIDVARQKGADLYLTSDVTYHRFFDANLLLVVAEHDETERPVLGRIADRLRRDVPGLDHIDLFGRTTSPIRWII